MARSRRIASFMAARLLRYSSSSNSISCCNLKSSAIFKLLFSCNSSNFFCICILELLYSSPNLCFNSWFSNSILLRSSVLYKSNSFCITSLPFLIYICFSSSWWRKISLLYSMLLSNSSLWEEVCFFNSSIQLKY